jgi:ribokinase
MTPNIVVIGSSNTDMVINVDHFPVGGETISGQKFMTVQGGKGANQAVSARRLGANVSLVCRLGMDSFGTESFKAYQSEGIDTHFIIRDEHEYSGVALIMVNKNAENVIAVVPNANARLLPEDVIAAEDIISKADCMML